MTKKSGFTLLEILIVLVLSASILAFALPAHKRAQARNKYSAAQGVLTDLASAVLAIRADAATVGGGRLFPPVDTFDDLGNLGPTAAWQDETEQDYIDAKTQPLASMTSGQLRSALFALNYMQPIPYDGTNTYKGYGFWICPRRDDLAFPGDCCNGDVRVVACMLLPEGVESNGYRGARVLEDLSLQRIE